MSKTKDLNIDLKGMETSVKMINLSIDAGLIALIYTVKDPNDEFDKEIADGWLLINMLENEC